MSIRLKVIAAVVIFVVSFLVYGNAVCEEGNPDKEIRGYVMFGGSVFDLDVLNARLDSKGYSEFSEDFASVGVGIFTRASDKFLTGIEGHILVGEQHSAVIGGNDYSANITGGYGFLNAGYLVIDSDRLDVFPILGIGFGGMGVKVGRNSFDAILDNPQGAARINTYSLLLNLALGADYKIALPGDGDQERFFIIGLRGGYAFAPYKSGWYLDDISLSGDPEGRIEGPYVHLTIGGGGILDPSKLDLFH